MGMCVERCVPAYRGDWSIGYWYLEVIGSFLKHYKEPRWWWSKAGMNRKVRKDVGRSWRMNLGNEVLRMCVKETKA